MDKTTLARRIREKRGIATQEEFAAQLGVSRQSVVRWEKSLAVPDEDALERLGIRMEFVEVEQ